MECNVVAVKTRLRVRNQQTRDLNTTLEPCRMRKFNSLSTHISHDSTDVCTPCLLGPWKFMLDPDIATRCIRMPRPFSARAAFQQQPATRKRTTNWSRRREERVRDGFSSHRHLSPPTWTNLSIIRASVSAQLSLEILCLNEQA